MFFKSNYTFKNKALRIMLCGSALIVASACSDKGVVARVGKSKITKAEVKLEVKKRGISDTEEAQKKIVADFAEMERLAILARRKKLDRSEGFLAERAIREREFLARSYQQEFIASDLPETELQAEVDNEILKRSGAEYHIGLIVVRTTNDNERLEEKAQDKITEAFMLLRRGADFAETAGKYSDDFSAKKGGDAGWVFEKSLEPQLLNVVEKLNPGEFSDPFRTGYAWTIMTLIEPPREKETDPDAVKQLSINRLITKKRKELLAELEKTYPLKWEE